ncbi:MAG: NACHT domain-containing protein, partial [Methanobacteriota archaeon]
MGGGARKMARHSNRKWRKSGNDPPSSKPPFDGSVNWFRMASCRQITKNNLELHRDAPLKHKNFIWNRIFVFVVFSAVAAMMGVQLAVELGKKGVEAAVEESGKRVINQVTKRLFKREIFKKKLTDMNEDEFKEELRNLLEAMGSEFVNPLNEAIGDVQTAQQMILDALQAIESKLSNQENLVDYLTKALREEIRQELITPQEFQEIFQVSYKEWIYDLQEDIETYLEQHQTSLQQVLQAEFAEYRTEFRKIYVHLARIEGLIEEGQIMNQQQYEEIRRQFSIALGTQNLAWEELLTSSARHMGWMNEHELFKGQKDISFNPRLFVDRGFGPLFKEFLIHPKKLFVVLGEAGLGKTWQLASFAHTALAEGHPVFFFPLHRGLNGMSLEIFGFRLADLEQKLSRLDLHKPIVFFFDGFDELRSKQEQGELISNFLSILNTTDNIKTVISSRSANWFQSRYTYSGEHTNIRINLFSQSNEPWSMRLERFSKEELHTASEIYREILGKDKIPPLDQWPEELQYLAHSPIWLRIISELYFEGQQPTSQEITLFTHYFYRMGVNDQQLPNYYPVLKTICTALLVNPDVPISLFDDSIEKVNELESMGVVERRGDRITFSNALFRNYAFALLIANELEARKFNMTRMKDDELRKAAEFLFLVDSTRLLEQMLIQRGVDKSTYGWLLAENRSPIDETTEPSPTLNHYALTMPSSISAPSKNLIQVIERMQTFRQTNRIPVADIAIILNRSIEQVIAYLTELISSQMIQASLDRKGTPNNPNDDELILHENWNQLAYQHQLLEKIRQNLVNPSLETLRQDMERIDSITLFQTDGVKKELERKIKELDRVKYKSVTLVREDAEALHELEEMVGEIPLVEKIGSTTFGFTVTNERVSGLALYNMHLATLPEAISNLIHLEVLDVGWNELRELPEWIGNLSNLEMLDMA